MSLSGEPLTIESSNHCLKFQPQSLKVCKHGPCRLHHCYYYSFWSEYRSSEQTTGHLASFYCIFAGCQHDALLCTQLLQTNEHTFSHLIVLTRITARDNSVNFLFWHNVECRLNHLALLFIYLFTYLLHCDTSENLSNALGKLCKERCCPKTPNGSLHNQSFHFADISFLAVIFQFLRF